MDFFSQAVQKLKGHSAENSPLSQEEYRQVMQAILGGQVSEPLIEDFLKAQAGSPLKAEALVATTQVLRDHLPLLDLGLSEEIKAHLIDTCGTGGDGQGTFNISTTAAFIAAGAGVPVAKHGNRSASSRSGSADCLSALGISLEWQVEDFSKILNECNFIFFFAPFYHKVMKRVAPIRKKLGIRTLFNLVGPLAHPLRVPHHVLGVYNREVMMPMAEALKILGTQKSWIVHSEDGLDEISPCAATRILEVTPQGIEEKMLSPETYGFSRCLLGDLEGGTPKENAQITEAILRGKEKGPKQACTLLNAAATIYVSGLSENFESGLQKARASISEGRAIACLETLRKMNHDLG
jgi:anthranilate phosphoribosyltransferase